MVLGSFCAKINGKPKIIQPKSLHITGEQKGFLLQLEINQSIKSNEAISEMSYILPTDNKLCIYHMKFQIGDKTIDAQIKSNKNAELIYEEAINSGKTVAMATQKEEGVTAIEIGNIPPNTTVSIIMSCALTSLLENPSVILTKIPLKACEPDGSVTYLYDLPSLEINLDLTISQLAQISDVTANCEYKYERKDEFNGRLTIDSAIITDENILIRSKFSNPVKSQIIQSEKYSCVSLIPEFSSIQSDKKEYVFLIDCSASMIGESMKKAKKSLKLFISHIPKESYFNIFKFGSSYKKVFDQSSKNHKINNDLASKFIDEMKPNLGGTEMLSMLKDIFNDKNIISIQRQIFLVTDGEVYQREKVVSLINENRDLNRIFAIGLGPGADAGFLEEIADITNGKSDFLFNAEELPNKICEYLELSKIEAAKGTEIQIAGNDSFQTVPYPLPPLLPNVLQNIFISSDMPIGENVMITAKLGENRRNEIEIENIISLKSDWNEKSAIFALFSQGLLKKLTNDEERSIKVSLESGVLSKFTSYIAVSDQVFVEKARIPKTCESFERSYSSRERNDYKKSTRRGCGYSSAIPDTSKRRCLSRPKKEYESNPRTCFKLPSGVEARPMSKYAAPRYYDEHDSLTLRKTSRLTSHMDAHGYYVDEPSTNSYEKSSMEETRNEIPKDWKNDASVSDIVRIQSRDGFWDLTSSFINEKCNMKVIKDNITFALDSALVEKRICSTLFAIAYLEKYYQELANKWKFAAEKGFRWLKKINSDANWAQIIDMIVPCISNK